MGMRKIRPAVLTAVLCLASAGAVWAQDKPRQVSEELAKILTGAQELLRQGQPAEALNQLTAYQGADHALRQLLIGHANVQQSKLPAAIAAYQAALRMDPKLSQAGLGLAQVYARQNKWGKAAELLGRFVVTDSCDADTLLLYAQVAQRHEDVRLCELLIEKAIERFPSDMRFRRLDLAVRIDQKDHLAAGQAVDVLLRSNPADPELWRQRAFVSDRADKQADAIAALEACLLCDPNDLTKHRRFVAALVIAGDWYTAFRHGQSLLAGPLAKSASADARLMGLLIRAADAGQKDDILGKWLKLVPDKSRTLDMGIVATRLALRLGELADARTALRGLIEQGQADAGVYLWAGHLAEKAKDWAEAETLYGHAMRQKSPTAALASLYLARLLLHRGRTDEAARRLRAYLDQHPQDSSARALLAVAKTRATSK